MKTCTCCKKHHDKAGWEALELVGVIDDEEGGTLELRNCSCTSTIAVQLTAEVQKAQEVA